MTRKFPMLRKAYQTLPIVMVVFVLSQWRYCSLSSETFSSDGLNCAQQVLNSGEENFFG